MLPGGDQPQLQRRSLASPQLQKLRHLVKQVSKLHTTLTKVICQVISQIEGEAMAVLVEIW